MTNSELCLPLPGLFGSASGPPTIAEWESRRRPELLDAFASCVYGRTPVGGGVAGVVPLTQAEPVLDGLATRQQLRVTLAGPRGQIGANLLLWLPAGASADAPAPVFVGLNFAGNHTTTHDAGIAVTPGWASDFGWNATAAERGVQARRWPVEIPLARGFAVATLHCAELEADLPGLAVKGVRGLFHSAAELANPAPDNWGAVGAWAWGLSRMLDVLADIPEIDASAAIVHGHSRLGKAALWAAAQDTRFAAAISNNSGCAGASLFRHAEGETIGMITRSFPHWFAPAFAGFQDNLAALPVDQHHLLALIAPRPVHVASATRDAHADPRGEFLATLHASPITGLYGHGGTVPPEIGGNGVGIPVTDTAAVPSPEAGSRVGGRLSYHLRDGVHDVLAEDWRHFVDVASTVIYG